MTRHAATVANLRTAAAKIDTANDDLAEAAALFAKFGETTAASNDQLGMLDESTIDPLMACEPFQTAFQRVGDLTEARKTAILAMNDTTASALLALAEAEDIHARVLISLDRILEAVADVNASSGENLLAVRLKDVSPTSEVGTDLLLLTGETPTPGEVRAAMMNALTAGAKPTLHLEEHEFGVWLAFGDAARRGRVFDAIVETCRAAENFRLAVGGFRKPTKSIARMVKAAEALADVPVTDLLEAWLHAGECIVTEARRQLAAIEAEKIEAGRRPDLDAALDAACDAVEEVYTDG